MKVGAPGWHSRAGQAGIASAGNAGIATVAGIAAIAAIAAITGLRVIAGLPGWVEPAGPAGSVGSAGSLETAESAESSPGPGTLDSPAAAPRDAAAAKPPVAVRAASTCEPIVADRRRWRDVLLAVWPASPCVFGARVVTAGSGPTPGHALTLVGISGSAASAAVLVGTTPGGTPPWMADDVDVDIGIRLRGVQLVIWR